MPRVNPYATASWVYLLECAGFHKIGTANEVEKRVKGMQVGNPLPIKIVKAWFCTEAAAVERKLHMRFVAQCTHGEWFRLSADDKELIAEIVKPNEIDPAPRNHVDESPLFTRPGRQIVTVSVPVAARMLNLSDQTIYRYLEMGELDGYQVRTGGKWLVLKSSMSKYLEKIFPHTPQTPPNNSQERLMVNNDGR